MKGKKEDAEKLMVELTDKLKRIDDECRLPCIKREVYVRNKTKEAKIKRKMKEYEAMSVAYGNASKIGKELSCSSDGQPASLFLLEIKHIVEYCLSDILKAQNEITALMKECRRCNIITQREWEFNQKRMIELQIMIKMTNACIPFYNGIEHITENILGMDEYPDNPATR